MNLFYNILQFLLFAWALPPGRLRLGISDLSPSHTFTGPFAELSRVFQSIRHITLVS